jgi:hypothetical protein
MMNRRLFVKSMGFSFIITGLLIVIAYLPIWEIMNDSEKSIFPIYGVISLIIIFCILTAVFYIDIRRILERKSI